MPVTAGQSSDYPSFGAGKSEIFRGAGLHIDRYYIDSRDRSSAPATDTLTVLRHAVELLERQLADKDRTNASLRGRLDQLLTLLCNRRPWWRRWFR
jgi:hypothetical protein